MSIKTITKTIETAANSIKVALYVLMVVRIMTALYLRIHKGLDEDYVE